MDSTMLKKDTEHGGGASSAPPPYLRSTLMKLFYGIVIGLFFGFLIAIITRPEFNKEPIVIHKIVKDIPDRFELQERLNQAGYYHGDIDGKIGPQTKEAWEKYICDRYAVEEFKKWKK